MIKEEIGFVKWFSDSRGYGFIHESEDAPEEFFVHFSSIDMNGFKTLKTGQKVTYTLRQTDKGIQAINVIPVRE